MVHRFVGKLPVRSRQPSHRLRAKEIGGLMGTTHRCPACGDPSARPVHPGCKKRVVRREKRSALKAKAKAAAEAAAKAEEKAAKDSEEEKPEGK